MIRKSSIKGVAVALLLASGTGLTRLLEGAQRSLRKASEALAVNLSDVRAMADAPYEESADDPSITDIKRK